MTFPAFVTSLPGSRLALQLNLSPCLLKRTHPTRHNAPFTAKMRSSSSLLRVVRNAAASRFAAPSRRAMSANHGHLPSSESPITSNLSFINSVTPDGERIPTFRVLDGTGKVLNEATMPEVSVMSSSPSFEYSTQALLKLDEALARRLFVLLSYSLFFRLNCASSQIRKYGPSAYCR